MNKLKAMQYAYNKKHCMHEKQHICHSINVDRYKILCEEFYSVKPNVDECLKIANEVTDACNQAQESFILWLNRE